MTTGLKSIINLRKKEVIDELINWKELRRTSSDRMWEATTDWLQCCEDDIDDYDIDDYYISLSVEDQQICDEHIIRLRKELMELSKMKWA